MKFRTLITIAWSLICSTALYASSLEVGKVCPVSLEQHRLGILVFSNAWYHSARHDASYVAKDNASGVGLEIHWFASDAGEIELANIANCDRYRFLQVRSTNRRLLSGEQASQIDVPKDFVSPFYDNDPLEYGRGTHMTPIDDKDKPWQGQVSRASTLAIYDTPYVSSGLGVEGQDINVSFETCVVCQREQALDSLLSCGSWSYTRDYIGGNTGWTEAHFNGVQCLSAASENYRNTINSQAYFPYRFQEQWY